MCINIQQPRLNSNIKHNSSFEECYWCRCSSAIHWRIKKLISQQKSNESASSRDLSYHLSGSVPPEGIVSGWWAVLCSLRLSDILMQPHKCPQTT